MKTLAEGKVREEKVREGAREGDTKDRIDGKKMKTQDEEMSREGPKESDTKDQIDGKMKTQAEGKVREEKVREGAREGDTKDQIGGKKMKTRGQCEMMMGVHQRRGEGVEGGQKIVVEEHRTEKGTTTTEVGMRVGKLDLEDSTKKKQEARGNTNQIESFLPRTRSITTREKTEATGKTGVAKNSTKI
jgi:hypothetical protein